MKRYVQIRILSFFVLALFSVSACRTAKEGVRMIESTPSLSKSEFVLRYSSLKEPIAVDTKGKVTLFSDGKSMASAIRWTYVRDKGFMLSVRPMNLIEIFRFTVTSKRIVILDRTGREAFVSEDPGEIAQVFEDLTGYHSSFLEGVIQNEPVSFSSQGVRALQDMKMTIERGLYKFYQKKNQIQISHYFDAQMNLVETNLSAGGREFAKINYSGFVREGLSYRSYPTQIDLHSGITSKPISLCVKLEKSVSSSSVDIDDSVPSGYNAMGILRLIKKIRTLKL